MRWLFLTAVWLIGCADRAPPVVEPADASSPDARPRDGAVMDADPPAVDAAPDRAVPDARPIDAAAPDAAPPVCEDADEDGVTNCRGDCDDTDPAVHPGAVEPCGGVDADCDGVVDERCVQPGDAVQWLPISQTAASTAGTAEQPRVDVRLPALADFRLLIDAEVVRLGPTDPHGIIELRFEGEGPTAWIHLRPERALFLQYRGRMIPMDGRVGTGGPVQMIVERVGGRLRAGVGDGTPGILDVPAAILPVVTEPPALVSVSAACRDCELRIERLDVARPHRTPPRPWVACANHLRNADFSGQTDGAPDRWRVQVEWTDDAGPVEPDHWRQQLARVQVRADGLHLPGGAPPARVIQAVELPTPCADWAVRIDGQGTVEPRLEATRTDDCPCLARQGAVALPGDARFVGCGGPATLHIEAVDDDAVIRQVDLVPADAPVAPCVAWPDRAPARLPVPWTGPWIDPQTGISRVPLRHPDGRLAGADVLVAIDKTVDVSYPALGGQIDIIWRIRRGAPALISLRLPARFPATIELPLPNAQVVREAGLQVVHLPENGPIASIAPTVTPTIDNPLAFAPVRLPLSDGTPGPFIPAARMVGRPRQLVAVDAEGPAGLVGAAHVAFVRQLGLGGLSVADPIEAQLAGLFGAAAIAPVLAIDLRLTRYGSIWTHDGLEPYVDQAQDVATAAEVCDPCGPIGLTALDEPLTAPLRRCAAEVAVSPPSELHRAVTACVGCAPLVGCRQAFPTLIEELFAVLRGALPAVVEIGINLSGGDFVAELPAAVFSFSSDWIRQDTAWSQSALERMAGIPGRLAGNTPVSATTAQRAPSAAAHQALVLQLAALGAQPIRLTQWPPDSVAILDAAVALERTLETLWPVFPARLTARLDTDHHRVWAAAYGEDLLLVINRTAQRQSVRVEPGPLVERLPGAALQPVVGAATLVFEPEVGLLRVGLAPHSAVLARLE